LGKFLMHVLRSTAADGDGAEAENHWPPGFEWVRPKSAWG